MNDLFLNFDLLFSYHKMREICGKTRDGEGRCMVECEYSGGGAQEKWIWFAGLKFILRRGTIEIRDLDYGYMENARVVSNGKYLRRIADIIMQEDASTLWNNRANRNFFRNRIRGIGRFTDNPYVKEDDIQKIRERCLSENPMDLAAEFCVSEFLVRKIRSQEKNKQKTV